MRERAAAEPSAGAVTPGMAGTLTAAGLSGPLQESPILEGKDSQAGQVKSNRCTASWQADVTCTHSSLQGSRTSATPFTHSGKK